MDFEDISVGTDIEMVARFNCSFDDPIISRVFSPRERLYCFSKPNPAMHLAARFCAKEAAVKALTELGVPGLLIKQFQVYRRKEAPPQLLYFEKMAVRPSKAFCFRVSLSHTKTHATATVLAWRKEVKKVISQEGGAS